jgi:urea carboxylase
METTTLALADSPSDEIDAFRRKQQAAFNEERARWAAMPTAAPAEAAPKEELPFGATLVETAILASVWKVVVAPGQYVVEGDVVVVLESMKMEMAIHSPVSGTVARVMVRPGQDVVPGQALLAVKTT